MPEEEFNSQNETSPEDNNPPEVTETLAQRDISSDPQERPEKKELLKRVEIRTMEKDVSKLREEEATREKQKIANLEAGKTQPSSLVPEAREDKKEEADEPGLLIPKAFRRQPAWQKIIIRIAAVLLALFAAGFIYWFFFALKNTGPSSLPQEEEPSQTEGQKEEPEQMFINPSPILTDSTTTLGIETTAEIPQALLTFLAEKPTEEGFIRILFKDNSANKIVQLKGFLEAFGTSYPEDLFGKVKDEFTLFSYYGNGNHRLGFVAGVQNAEGLPALMKAWEITIEQDTNNLFQVLGKTDKSLIPYFRQVNYKGAFFRFLTISRADFGICYALPDDYLVFTTSFESMQKVINQLTQQ